MHLESRLKVGKRSVSTNLITSLLVAWYTDDLYFLLLFLVASSWRCYSKRTNCPLIFNPSPFLSFSTSGCSAPTPPGYACALCVEDMIWDNLVNTQTQRHTASCTENRRTCSWQGWKNVGFRKKVFLGFWVYLGL